MANQKAPMISLPKHWTGHVRSDLREIGGVGITQLLIQSAYRADKDQSRQLVHLVVAIPAADVVTEDNRSW